ncbi:MAG: ABC transporter ATP-binding protein [Ilumatobacteraceae bacterium]
MARDPDPAAAIETLGLARSFGDLVAVDGLDLSVGCGELFSLLGPNGAGKTTTLRMLSCLLRPTSGSASVLGHDIRDDALAVKRVIAISPQETAIAEHLSAEENLALMAGVHGIGRAETAARSAELLDTMALTERASEKAKHYSGGMKRRLSIAMALVTDPQVVFLDEPTIGLDPQSRRGMWDYIARLKGSMTIVLTTHYLEEADALADRIAIVDDGRIVARGSPDELKAASSAGRATIVEASGWTDDAIAALRDRYPDAARNNGIVEIHCEDVNVDTVTDCLRPFDVGLTGVYRRPVTLDDVFLELTGKQLRR